MKCRMELQDPPGSQAEAAWLPQSLRTPESTGCMGIWAAVVEQAVKDLRDDRELVRRGARQWITDAQPTKVGGFAWICDLFGVDLAQAQASLLQRADEIDAASDFHSQHL